MNTRPAEITTRGPGGCLISHGKPQQLATPIDDLAVTLRVICDTDYGMLSLHYACMCAFLKYAMCQS